MTMTAMMSKATMMIILTMMTISTMRTIIFVRKFEDVHKKVGGNLIASIALNDESLVSKSVRYVGIELLGQLKTQLNTIEYRLAATAKELSEDSLSYL